MLELRSQAAGDISALRIAQERLRVVEGSLADAQRRGQAQAATIETQGLQMEQLRVALQVCATSVSAWPPNVLFPNKQDLQVKQLRVAMQVADASCCICMPRLTSIQTEGLQIRQLRVAAQVGDASCCINSMLGAAAYYALHPPSHAANAIPAPHCAMTSLCLTESQGFVLAKMFSEATVLCLLQAAQAQAHSAGAFYTGAAGR